MRNLLQDVRYGLRMLLNRPGFTVIAVITLALGIGANTAIFSLVNSLLLRPLPYKEPDRIVMVWESNRPRSFHQNVISLANFLDWQDQSKSFEQMAGFFDVPFNLTGTGEPEEIPSQAVSTNLFSLLGVEPIKGRSFLLEESQPGKDQVIILSYDLWQRRFAGDSGIVGKTVSLNGQDFTVVGVMPAGFKWFIKKGSLTGKPAELWTPITLTAKSRVRAGRYMSAVARLKPGVTLEQAQAEINTIASRLEQQYPDFDTGWGVELVPLHEQFVGEIRYALLILLGVVGFVLLIACANVANLLLARAASRQKEIAIRSALGASRKAIIRQLMTESVLLAGLGGVLGLLLALWGVDLLVSFTPPNLLALQHTGVSLPVLGFTLGVSLLTGIIFGLVPALEVSRPNLNESLKESGKSATGSPRASRLRNLLVMGEVALGVVLLVAAGLMIKSLLRLNAVNPGFSAENLLTMRVQLPRANYREDYKRIAFFKQAVERIQALPGVRSAGAISYLPFTGLNAGTDFTIEGRPAPEAGEKPITDVSVVDENYFRTMKIPVVMGRTFNAQEETEGRQVAVINETMARTFWPNESPIGKRILVNMTDPMVPTEIIGVVGDVKHTSLDSEVKPTVYWPHPQLAYGAMSLVIRTDNDPLSLATAVEREIQAIDKDQPVSDVRTMQQWLAEASARARFSTLLLTLFASLALILAAVGLYGVMSYMVVQRTHEIGIRMALGARTGDVLKLVVRQGIMMSLAGVAIGLVAAFALTRLMSSLLYQVSATDPSTFAAISIFFIAVALLASYIPARRATRVDPMVALRYE
ncbi:MAG: ABC transporter permease [Acidobacteriota bacterium]|nr:ABC transporter permease [Acidobacteriota bacterium]